MSRCMIPFGGDPPAKLRPYLYLGSGKAAQDKAGLEKLGITHILNVADDVDCFHPEHFVYHHVQIVDGGQDASIVACFEGATAFVKDAAACADNKVLVHCFMGINRSATVAMAVLMNMDGIDLRQAYEHAKLQRSRVEPFQGNKEKIACWELETRQVCSMPEWLPPQAKVPAGPTAQEQDELLRTISDIARQGLIDDDTKGMLKGDVLAGMDALQVRARIENITQGGCASEVLAMPKEEFEAPPAECAPPPADTTDVFIVRHGERYDEVPGNAWYHECGQRWFDPPLTEKGKLQAEEAAEALETLFGGAKPFDAVYCSPLQRCVSTAVPFSRKFGAPIQVVPGLGECCAALRGSMGSAADWERTEFFRHLLSLEDLKALCPGTAFSPEESSVEPYLAANESCPGRLARGRQRILIVTHREGIRDLVKLGLPIGGLPVRIVTQYCCVAQFRYNHAAVGNEAKKWSHHGMLHKGTARGK